MVFWDDKYVKCRYPCTNESIPAVIYGLSLEKSDIVLSILGSGDIPFAIAPYVKKVYAVDISSAQIDFANTQIENIKNGDFATFCCESLIDKERLLPCDIRKGDIRRRKEYFSKQFGELPNHVDKIEIIEGSIFEFMGKLGVNSIDKLYLSNALNISERVSSVFFESSYVLTKSLALGGLTYVSVEFDGKLNGQSPFRVDYNKKILANGLERELNPSWYWKPSVYRKVA